jgi:hypothetical protein
MKVAKIMGFEVTDIEKFRDNPYYITCLVIAVKQAELSEALEKLALPLQAIEGQKPIRERTP